jgi:hypothetical protein
VRSFKNGEGLPFVGEARGAFGGRFFGCGVHAEMLRNRRELRKGGAGDCRARRLDLPGETARVARAVRSLRAGWVKR